MPDNASNSATAVGREGASFITLMITRLSHTAKPAEVGFSSEHLDRITQLLRDDIGKGVIPGAVLLIARHGKVAYFETLGVLDPDTKAPMTKDAIFRIYSMSKPITTVAGMMLYEHAG